GSTGSGGGAVFSAGTAALTNCTLTANASPGGGGAVFSSDSSLTLTNCTLTGNRANSQGDSPGFSTGGGLSGAPGASLTLTNTIVAGNFAGTGSAADDVGSAVTGTFNLIGAGGSGGLTNGSGGNLVGVANPLLAPLGSYGGPTQTVALLPGSPALDAGTASG